MVYVSLIIPTVGKLLHINYDFLIETIPSPTSSDAADGVSKFYVFMTVHRVSSSIYTFPNSRGTNIAIVLCTLRIIYFDYLHVNINPYYLAEIWIYRKP